jgi:hypothetical protein
MKGKTIFDQLKIFNDIREEKGDYYYFMSKSDIEGIVGFLKGEIEDEIGHFQCVIRDCYEDKDLKFFEMLLQAMNYDEEVIKNRKKEERKADKQIPISLFEDWMFGDDISEEDTEETP